MQVTIRPLQENDALISYVWRNNPIVWKYTGSRPNKTITYAMEKEWIKNVLLRINEKRFAILADNKYVGNTYLTDISNKKAEFHIFIGDSNYWGKGIAGSAILEVLSYAKDINLQTIYLEVHQDNIPALRLYHKVGFIKIDQKDEMIRMEKALN